MEIQIIRSNRKTLALQITPDAQLLVRAPMHLPEEEIQKIIRKKQGWIQKHIQETKERLAKEPPRKRISQEEIQQLAEQAAIDLPKRAAHFAPIVGVTYGRITIRCQKTRWGSCNSKGNLNFNCLLMLTPENVRDYVIVHELCHRLEMNHSPKFWAEVARVLPEYKSCVQWLKEHEAGLLDAVRD